MQTGIVDILAPKPLEASLPSRRTEQFERELTAAQAAPAAGVRLAPGKQAELRQAAEQFVSSAFVLPLLAQMRDDPFRSDLFHGGQGEDAFQSQLDTILADRITRGARFPLVDTIVDKILSGYGARAGRASSTSPSAPAGVDTHG